MKKLLLVLSLLMALKAQAVGSFRGNFKDFKEDLFLGSQGEARLYSLGEIDPEKEPLIFVHGINGAPADLKPLMQPFMKSKYQIFFLAYADNKRLLSRNAKDFAQELMVLRDLIIGEERDLTIVAHSMGGILSRSTLNVLKDELQLFGKIRLFTIDSPWAGFAGPDDSGAAGRFLMTLSRPFLPDGFEDMRARSDFFKGLFQELPGTVKVHLAFAEEGKAIKDYFEVKGLVEKILRYYQNGETVDGNPFAVNFWGAMQTSLNFWAFDLEVRSRPLTKENLNASLKRHFPHFSGSHDGILRGNYISFLENELRK